ncbi:hypothetical protein [Rhodococcus spongiicola]|uniref:hypothetical protein n=1 Tax=Rhodococcus spongiicola TaxID=2487352 RepID=UPI0013E3C189|nr:hypothetical protein [Rhodococcus spongiicola]
MIKSVRAAAAAALAAPLLAAAFAAPANAAPKDVALSVDVVGNDIEVIITNNTQGWIACNWTATSGFLGDVYFRFMEPVQPGGEYREPLVVADGRYDVSWNCISTLSIEKWGNTPDTGTAGPYSFTAPPCNIAGSLGSLGSTDSGSLGSTDLGSGGSTDSGSLGSANSGSGGSLGSFCGSLGGS